MSETAQIYIMIDRQAADEQERGTMLSALHFSWLYGSRMISRAQSLTDFLSDRDNLESLCFYGKWNKLADYARVNFDLRSVASENECSDLLQRANDELASAGYDKGDWRSMVFNHYAENGKLFIHVCADGGIHMAFTDNKMTRTMTAQEYMDWGAGSRPVYSYNMEEGIHSHCAENIAWLNEHIGADGWMSLEQLQNLMQIQIRNLPPSVNLNDGYQRQMRSLQKQQEWAVASEIVRMYCNYLKECPEGQEEMSEYGTAAINYLSENPKLYKSICCAYSGFEMPVGDAKPSFTPRVAEALGRALEDFGCFTVKPAPKVRNDKEME